MYNTTAIILAGGRSSRMGSEKAFLPWREYTIIEFLISRLTPIFDHIMVVTKRPDKFIGLPAKIVEDEFPEYAALVGLYSGLKATQTETNLVIPCDMPLIPSALVMEMGAISMRYEAVILERADHERIPFPGYYHRSLLPALAAAIHQKEFGITRFLKDCVAHVLPESAWKYLDPDGHAVINLNTREEYREAYILAGEHREHLRAQ